MAAQKLCTRNKFGYCKYNRQCQLKHNNQLCENEHCKISTCEMRHPKECIWFRDFERCKFSNCAYKHIKKRSFKSDFDSIAEKLKVIEEQIKIKSTEEAVQQKKVSDIENSVRETALEAKVSALENLVSRLEEKLEMFEQEKKNVKSVDYSSFDKLHSLVRSKSLEV